MSRILSAVAMAFGGAVLMTSLTAPAAEADTEPAPAADSGRSLVVMGDSNTANATLATMQAQPAGVACTHLATSWPTQLGQRMNLGPNDIDDVSCVGAYMYRHGEDHYWTALTEARQAAADGAFGPRTKAVLLQFGLNDAWGADHQAQNALVPCVLNVLQGCSTADAATDGNPPILMTGQDYATNLKDIITYIRYYAPNARIVLVGYQELHTPGSDAACVGVLGVPVGVPHAGAITDVFDSLRTAPKEGAALLGVDYFDTAAATAGHGLCTPDPWLNGIFTPGPDVFGQPGHPTLQGDTAVATALQQYLTTPAAAN